MTGWLPECEPQTEIEAAGERPWPEIVDAATARGIERVVHFTRRQGLTGIARESAIKARADLPYEDQLKYVYADNMTDRSRDVAWHGYVNLSITAINVELFKASQRQHPGESWLILAFHPRVLATPGVVFCTTNNAYPVVHRSRGSGGFDQMFAPKVPWGKFGSVRTRFDRADHETTCPQAEALYPKELPLTDLSAVLVPDEDTLDAVIGTLSHYPHDDVDINIEPEAFT